MRYKTQFWIDPTGKIHKWKGEKKDAEGIPSFHSAIASDLFKDSDCSDSFYPDDYLCKQGWIKHNATYGDNIIYKRPTEAQIKTLRRLKSYTLKMRVYSVTTYDNTVTHIDVRQD